MRLVVFPGSMAQRVWVFWQGWGWLVPVIALGGLALTQLVTEALYGPGSYSTRPAAQALGVSVAVVALWLAGHGLEARRRRLAADAGGPEPRSPGRADSFYAVPMKGWAYLGAGLYALMEIWA